MTKTQSEVFEPASRSLKRNRTRSVSNLTPAQRARKRASDREAQNAKRARTKEHIERLERELEELKSQHSRDKTVQDLLRRNKMLEDEVARFGNNMGIVNSTLSLTASDDNLNASSSATPSYGMSLIDCNNSSHCLDYLRWYQNTYGLDGIWV